MAVSVLWASIITIYVNVKGNHQGLAPSPIPSKYMHFYQLETFIIYLRYLPAICRYLRYFCTCKKIARILNFTVLNVSISESQQVRRTRNALRQFDSK